MKTTQAFCIYNTFTDGTLLYVHQYDNFGDKIWGSDSKFKAEIKAGEKACCHWTAKTCNALGNKMASTRFVIWTSFSNHGRIGLNMIYVLSDGYAQIGGDSTNPTILSFFADGGRYVSGEAPTTEDYSEYY